ncbi:MAG: YggS family pyridoxal phosphate-dependent enzyme [Deltaproteobacteria bacterium]|nr:YggS family pyridoxal phosphate-dependent enzyme [Deltaproteobacteria bacterium]
MSPIDIIDIGRNIEIVRQRILSAAKKTGRNPSDIKIVAITKNVDIEKIKQAISCGIDIFGENYIQEAKEKISNLKYQISNIRWHFTGSLQKNKVKYAVHLFDMIETVDNIELAQEIDKRMIDRAMEVLIQVNIGAEKTKSGCSEQDASTLAKEISRLKNISIKGLMTMHPFCQNPEDARPHFKRLFEISKDIEMQDIENVSMKELSMGMSNDFEAAIEEGATFIRIGTAIFGERTAKIKRR